MGGIDMARAPPRAPIGARSSYVIVLVDTSSAVPAYEQIRAQIAALANSGALPARTRLPSVRQLAEDLGIATGTVAKAYQQLDETGITTAHRRRSNVISDRTTSSAEVRLTSLRAAAVVYADTSRLLNVDVQTAAELVADALKVPPR